MNQLENTYKIIPVKGFPKEKGQNLDLVAIAYWAATGFFLENDSFWKEVKWHELDFKKQPWSYEPRDISLDTAVTEFASLFHEILEEQIAEKQVILPLSGGLDSRTLAVALKYMDYTPFCYSYEFEGSFKETHYGQEIARVNNWPFQAYTIPSGYLWDRLENSASLNHCYAEFTHARQVAVADKIGSKGDVWLLGHWGDVLFDDMGVDNELPENEQINVLRKKILKKGGLELGSDLWKHWGIEGDFEQQINVRLEQMLANISIGNANARIRAFKSLYWATRWTSTNLVYFEKSNPLALPYYDDRMCKFIMTIPEKHLAGRQIQIEYIKRYGPKLAEIAWQDVAPYNLYNSNKFLTPHHLPYRIFKKLGRLWKEKIVGQPLVQRNWEIQFLGEENPRQLKKWLFDNPAFLKLVPKEISEKYYNLFKTNDHVYWSHPVSMLITLSLFAKENLG